MILLGVSLALACFAFFRLGGFPWGLCLQSTTGHVRTGRVCLHVVPSDILIGCTLSLYVRCRTFLSLALSDAGLLTSYYAWRGLPKDAFRGKTVWITGASSGIGEGFALFLASLGAQLILSARREPELERVKKACLCKGSSCFVQVESTAW
jgi:hypothetical protein